MRQSGRTTRIVNHAIDRLLSEGFVYVYDHDQIEDRDRGSDVYILKELEAKIRQNTELRRALDLSGGTLRLGVEVVPVHGRRAGRMLLVIIETVSVYRMKYNDKEIL